MKKIFLITLTIFLNLGLYSCSPQEILDRSTTATETETGCCGDDGEILPSPPPSGN